MRSLRILHVSEANAAGSGRVIADVLGGALNAGRDVHLIYSATRTDDGFRRMLEKLSGLKAVVVNMKPAPHPQDLRVLSIVCRYLRRHGPFDIIHGHASKGGAMARLAGTIMGVPSIYTPHCIVTLASDFNRVWKACFRWMECLMARYTSIIIAESEEEYDHLQALGVPKAKIRHIPLGVEAPSLSDKNTIRASLGLPLGAPLVGFVGRLCPQKNPHLAVEAFADATHDMPQARLAMVGTGKLEAEVRSLASSLGVDQRVDWLGYQPGPEVMRAFDILVVPSKFDTGPLVMMEAMACGVPIVITNVGCVRSVLVNGEGGFIVPVDDRPAMSAALRRLLQSPHLREQFATAAAAKSPELSVNRMVSETLAVYEELHRLQKT